jgi:hypothetical protein
MLLMSTASTHGTRSALMVIKAASMSARVAPCTPPVNSS